MQQSTRYLGALVWRHRWTVTAIIILKPIVVSLQQSWATVLNTVRYDKKIYYKSIVKTIYNEYMTVNMYCNYSSTKCTFLGSRPLKANPSISSQHHIILLKLSVTTVHTASDRTNITLHNLVRVRVFQCWSENVAFKKRNKSENPFHKPQLPINKTRVL